MATTDRPARRPYGSGSIRTRRPGVFELRVHTPGGARSITVHGTRDRAETALAELSAATHRTPSPAALLSLAELLQHWLAADHPWKPSTLVGYRSNARFLSADPLGQDRAQQLTPQAVRRALARWRADGASDAVLAARFRVLRTALSWAYDERFIDLHPIRYMRGPGRVPPRRPLTDHQVQRLLTTAETLLLEAIANDRDHLSTRARRHAAEQDLLMVRLAADTGARRGELAALRCAATTSTAACSSCAGPSPQATSPLPSRVAGAFSPWAPARPACGTCSTEPGASETPRFRSGPGCSAPTPLTSSGSPPRPWVTGSPASGTPPVFLVRPCTGCATTWPPSSSRAGRSCRPRSGSATQTRLPPCASTPTPSR